jgi:alanine racemase
MLAKKLSDSLRTWIEIDHAAIRHNVGVFRKLIGPIRPFDLTQGRQAQGKPHVKLWVVVKSNAYGHGLMAYSPLANKAGVDGFCVDSIVEGLRLRELGIKKPILVLGLTLPNRFVEAARKDIAITISNFEALKYLAKQKTPPKFHVKFDTGMHRQGFFIHDAHRVLKILAANGNGHVADRLEGIFTHFAAAKDLRDTAYTERQFGEFMHVARAFKGAGYDDLIRHVSATGGTLLGKKYHLDAVRVGIGLYGLFPSPELERQLAKRLALKPVLSWRTVVGEVKRLVPGDRVGYDLTERIRVATIAAIIPVGYWHGLPRSLSSVGQALVRGKRVKIIGRVSMDMAVLGATGVKPRVGDLVTLIGRDGDQELRAVDVSRDAGTTHYEFLTRLNPLMERIVL